MPITPELRAAYGSYGAHIRWSRTPDRKAAMAKTHAANPSRIEWHIAKVRANPAFAHASEADVLAAAESHRRAYFTGMALRRWKQARVRSAHDGAPEGH